MPNKKTETAKPESKRPETLQERIDFLLALSKGQCPYGMVVYSQEDFDKATELLKKNKKAAKLISVILEKR